MRFLLLIGALLTVLTFTRGEPESYARSIAVTTVLKTGLDGTGRPIRYPEGEPEVTGVVVEIPAGESTGWHVHPRPCVAYVLEGEVTVEFADAPPKHFKAGDALSEVVDVPHCGFNRSTKPVRILMFVMGEKGVPISRKIEK